MKKKSFEDYNKQIIKEMNDYYSAKNKLDNKTYKNDQEYWDLSKKMRESSMEWQKLQSKKDRMLIEHAQYFKKKQKKYWKE